MPKNKVIVAIHKFTFNFLDDIKVTPTRLPCTNLGFPRFEVASAKDRVTRGLSA